MLELKYSQIYKNFLAYFFFVYFVYAVIPFLLSFNNLFEYNIIRQFLSFADIEKKLYIQNILSKINYNYLFLLNSILFFILFYLIKKFILNKNSNDNYPDKIFFFFSNIILIICTLFLIKDCFDYYFYYIELIQNTSFENPFLDRVGFYLFFEERKQTHFIVGSIFAIFSIKNKNYIFSITFIILLLFIEITSLSRFYMFLIFISFLIFTKKKFLLYILSLVLIAISYRGLILSADLFGFLSSLLFEPVSLVSNEIIKILNGISEFNQPNFFKRLILDNFFINFIFFDYSNSFYIFEAKTYKHSGSYAQYGLLDLIAYPVQIFFLVLSIIILRKINEKFYNLKELYLVTCIIIIFMIIRGSAIYGLSFLIKMQLIFLFISFISYCLKKIKQLKT